MSISFRGKTADKVWRQAAIALKAPSVRRQDSRLGATREILHASLEISEPRQRWVLSRTPAISPAFAIAEALWILAGRNDARFLNFWNPALPKYAGTGESYYGAYGYRLRSQFGFDQIEAAIDALAGNDISRQFVLQIWDPKADFPINGIPRSADIPCNICSLLKLRDGRLEWMQIMRSNDIFRGTPYNFVQFTILQEVIAGCVGAEVGDYIQIADSMHCYESDLAFFNEDSAPALRSRDRLSLPREEAASVVSEMVEKFEYLSRPELIRSDIGAEFIRNVPEGWRNLLAIGVADSARRRGWADIQERFANECSNEPLRRVWQGWANRSRVSG